MNIIYVLVIGMVIGMANVIPGVSGGTMAVVFNIYDKFVNAITLNLKKLKENWKFLVPLLGGMALGIWLFSKIIEELYNAFPVQTNYFFTGLIIGSIPMLVKYMLGKNNKKLIAEGKMDASADKPMTVKYGIVLFICFAVGLALILIFDYLSSVYGTPLGAVAMVIPGISGSLLMLIFGVWQIVIGAIDCIFNLSTCIHAILLLLPNGIGVIIGILLGAKLISILLKKVPGLTYAVIVGLIVGSAYTLFPGFSEIHSAGRAIGCVITLCAGIALAFFSSVVTEPKKDKTNPEGEQN